MNTLEKITSFLTLVSLPIMGPPLGRFLAGRMHRLKTSAQDDAGLAPRFALLIALGTLLCVYGVLWNVNNNLVSWFRWGDGFIHVDANVSGDVGVSGEVEAEVGGNPRKPALKLDINR